MKCFRARPIRPEPVVVMLGGVYCCEFGSLDEALRRLWLSRLSLSECTGFVALSREDFAKPLLLSFHSGSGRWIRPEDVMARVYELLKERAAWIPSWRIPYDPSTFREAPVPRTGKPSRYRRRRRYIKTTQERRAAAAAEADRGEVPKLRARRGMTNLPDSREGILRRRSRSWKEHRRTRWKE